MMRYMKIAQAAELCGLTKRKLWLAIEAGQLQAKDFGTGSRRDLRITEADLSRYIEARPSAGTPRPRAKAQHGAAAKTRHLGI